MAVCAPAGYGKTTAVLQWDVADDRRFAWLRLDRLDDDPARLLVHTATALSREMPVQSRLLKYLGGPGRDPLAHLVPALVRALDDSGPVVVVIDDCQTLSAPQAVEALAALIDKAPTSTTFALVGRGIPVDLGRRRLERRLVEVGTGHLELSADEAAAAFRAVGRPQDSGTVTAVLEKCEGWAAGVLLAALALRDGADAETFTGRHRLVADYLVEEVLSHLDTQTTTFLTESSILDRVCAAHLDAVLCRNDSAQYLSAITESGNMFLVSLDGERIWYRYHRLFGDVLRARLRERDPVRFRQLAACAADLLEAERDIDGAILQALAAEDRARAAQLVGREAVRLGFDGRAGVLARRLALLDERTFSEYPDAAMARAWHAVTTGDAELIQRSLVMANRADCGLPLADGAPSVKVAAALVGSLVGVGGVREVVRHAEVVRSAGDHLVNPWWGAATVMMGAAKSMMGETVAARRHLEAALPVIGDLPGFRAAALAHLALLDLAEGDDAMAAQRSSAACAIADAADLYDVVPMVVVYAVNATIAARTGNVERARVSVAVTERLLSRLGYLAARTALLGHGLLAWTAAVLGDTELLRRHIQAGDRARRLEPDAVALWQRLDRVRALATTRDDRRPLTAAELRLLPYLSTHLSLQRIAEELMIGRETAKSQATSIYRKLSVSSRAAAVAEAVRLGLLNG